MSERDGARGEVRRFLIVFGVVLNLFALDLLTKQFAAVRLKGSAAHSVIGGFFDFAYVENRGCAWGMFQGHVWPLALVALVALAFILWKRQALFVGRLGAVAEPLLYAGIIGNLFDRLQYGYVIDFIDLHWHESYHFPCFNVADVCISVAAGLLLLSAFVNPHEKKSAK